MSNFNPTHEFQGLKLEHHEVDGYIEGLGSYYDEDGTQYRLSSDVVTKIVSQPKPGELWYVRRHMGMGPMKRGMITNPGTSELLIVYTDGSHDMISTVRLVREVPTDE